MKEPAIIASVPGAFVPNLSFGAGVLGACPPHATVSFEARLLPRTGKVGAERLVASSAILPLREGRPAAVVELRRSGGGRGITARGGCCGSVPRPGRAGEARRPTRGGHAPAGRGGALRLGPLLLDCFVPEGRDLVELSGALKATLGAVEHGLLLGMADQAFPGNPGRPCRDAVQASGAAPGTEE
jgi:hypothetical protein